jgi:hypothetical protein
MQHYLLTRGVEPAVNTVKQMEVRGSKLEEAVIRLKNIIKM